MVCGFLFTQPHLFPSNLFLSFINPSLPSHPVVQRHSLPVIWSQLTRGCRTPSPPQTEKGTHSTQCQQSSTQSPAQGQPWHPWGSKGGTGNLLGGWAEFFCPAKPRAQLRCSSATGGLRLIKMTMKVRWREHNYNEHPMVHIQGFFFLEGFESMSLFCWLLNMCILLW